MADKVETILVTSGRDDDRVALWERHPDHPDGEVYVAGKVEVEVAKTPRVHQQLSRGQLVEVKATKSSAKSSEPSKSGSK